jgi:Tol biopolymer transport system component
LIAVATLVTAGTVAADALGAAKTTLVSRQSHGAGGDGADADATRPSISGKGRFVAFNTEADNLGGPIDPGVDNVYVYDRRKRKVELVSRRSRGGPGGDGDSFVPAISANGRYVAFLSEADNLGGPRDASVQNIYVYDRKRDRVKLVSRRSGSGPGGDGDSREPSVSATGRFVAFTTDADNLGGPAGDAFSNVYVYDLERRKASLVSRRSGGGPGGNGESDSPSISGSGRFVAISTDATNLGGPLNTTFGTVYVYDRKRQKMQMVARRSHGGAGADGSAYSPRISANGRVVAMISTANNLGGPLDTEVDNIYAYDRKRRKMELISRVSNGGPGSDGFSAGPAASATGRYVAFDTNATNLGGPIDASSNVYLFDRRKDQVALISRRSGHGAGANDDSSSPSVSAGALFVAFQTDANNLGGPLDTDFRNVYVRARR